MKKTQHGCIIAALVLACGAAYAQDAKDALEGGILVWDIAKTNVSLPQKLLVLLGEIGNSPLNRGDFSNVTQENMYALGWLQRPPDGVEPEILVHPIRYNGREAGAFAIALRKLTRRQCEFLIGVFADGPGKTGEFSFVVNGMPGVKDAASNCKHRMRDLLPTIGPLLPGDNVIYLYPTPEPPPSSLFLVAEWMGTATCGKNKFYIRVKNSSSEINRVSGTLQYFSIHEDVVIPGGEFPTEGSFYPGTHSFSLGPDRLDWDFGSLGPIRLTGKPDGKSLTGDVSSLDTVKMKGCGKGKFSLKPIRNFQEEFIESVAIALRKPKGNPANPVDSRRPTPAPNVTGEQPADDLDMDIVKYEWHAK